MSLQEAASSGSFDPRAAQSTDPQRAELPFPSAAGDAAADQMAAEPTSPFGHPFDYSGSAGEELAEDGAPDMRASRRRAWTVVSMAIVIPAAVAGIIAWQLFGSDPEPAPTVTRVTTTPAAPVTSQVEVGAAAPAQTSTSTATDNVATTAATTTQAASVTTSGEATVAEPTTSAAAVAAAEPAADLSELDPAARLAAWTDLETIQVLPGETLWLIAQNYNTTISAIATLNNITDPSTLSIGQELVIPVGFAEDVVATSAVADAGAETVAADEGSVAITAAVADAPQASEELANWQTIAPVVIEEGDSLQAIALANDTTVEAIMALNGISDPNLIYIGTSLLVPVGYQGDAGVIVNSQQNLELEAGAETTASETTEDLMEEETAASGANDDMMEE
ncbi:MAG: LysM peptidoglycan-binding domain-containing protein [Chloroflexota bacterium]|nr:LysM peptidoglycan-binding domain-containing protein [Chloroflexota bacterium]